jgi:predicted hydrocarbon binding protein
MEMHMTAKNISIDSEHLKKLQPYIDKHNGNFSSAIREIIDKTEKSIIPDNSSCVYNPLFNWLLNEVDGRLIPEDILNMMVPKFLIHKISEIDAYVNRSLASLDWNTTIRIDCDNAMSPSSVLITIIGDSQKTKIVSVMMSQFIVENSSESSPFAIRSMTNLGDSIRVELFSIPNKKDGIKSLITFFGGMEETAKAIKNRASLWKCLIHRHVASNYQMVTIHKNYYEDMLAGEIPMGEIMIEILAKKPIREISLKDLLPLIRQVYEGSGVVDRVEIRDSSIILFHSYRNKNAIERIKKSLIMLMETNGHLYDGKITTNMIVLSHRPDVGMKINSIVENLKHSNSKLDQELVMFMVYLKDLKNIHDTPMSISVLGRRIGTSLIQEYEKENNIKQWDLTNFQKAFTLIDSKIHRESEWKLEENNLLYKIKKCDIVTEGNAFDAYTCRAAREAFKGALSYAFGNRAELQIKRLVTHGDSHCEVSIKLPQ